MWLLSTARAELRYFVGPDDVPGGYAILSHVWLGNEQSFKDTQDLRERCAKDSANPRDYASEKIKRFCQLAELHGYAWAWADSCCIDKSSSSELSEAINSMFRYYSLAQVCYVYLHDVPSWEHDTRFRSSKWHSRGWTLQELIAPATVLFLSTEWDLLGTKLDFARTLAEVTNVPEDVLTLRKDVRAISIAQRLSWAARRQTTRPEDEAYCLMGIFGINMPTLYGEGRAAFRRLQEEIMRKSVDTSLFAWGFNVHHVQPSSPREFMYSQKICFKEPRHFERNEIPPTSIDFTSVMQRLPRFAITPYGVLAQMAVLHVAHKRLALLLSSRVPSAEDTEFLNAGPLCFELYACPDAVDPTRPIYHPVRRWLREVLPRQPRLFHVEWEEFYLSQEPSAQTAARHISHPVNASLFSPFHVDTTALLRSLSDCGVEEILPFDGHHRLRNPWNGDPPAAFLFRTLATYTDRNTIWEFVVHLGRCGHKSASRASCAPFESHHDGPLWANVSCLGDGLSDEGASLLSAPSLELVGDHDCAVDHIEQWPARSRLTGILTPRAFNKSGSLVSRTVKFVQLSFAPSHLQPVGAPRRLELGVDILDAVCPPLGSGYSGGTVTSTEDLSSTCLESDSDDSDVGSVKVVKRRRSRLSVDEVIPPTGVEELRDIWKSRRCTSLAPVMLGQGGKGSKLFL